MTEPKRRIRMRPTIEDIAISVLTEAGIPLNYREIASRVLEARPMTAANPTKSVYAVLLRSKKIVPVGGGVFELKSRSE